MVGHFFVSLLIVAVAQVLVSLMLRRVRKENRYAAVVFSMRYLLWTFSTIVLLGAFANVTVWIEAAAISVVSAAFVGLTRFVLLWPEPLDSRERSARSRVSWALVALRAKRGNLRRYIAMLSCGYLIPAALYIYAFFVVGLPGLTGQTALIRTLTAFIVADLVYDAFIVAITAKMVVQESTDEATRTFAFGAWIALLTPGIVTLVIMRYLDGASASALSVSLPTGKTLSLPLAAGFAVILVVQFCCYMSGVQRRRIRVRGIESERKELADRLDEYASNPIPLIFDSVTTSIERAVKRSAARAFTPLQILATAFGLAPSVSRRLVEYKRGLTDAEAGQGATDGDRLHPVEPEGFPWASVEVASYWRTTGFPEQRWLQVRWLLSWYDDFPGSTASQDVSTDALTEVQRAIEGAVDELVTVLTEYESIEAPWYATDRWTLLTHRLESLPTPSKEVVEDIIASLDRNWKDATESLPRLKWPARWIQGWANRVFRLTKSFVTRSINNFVTFMGEVTRVLRRMPKQELEWAHYNILASVQDTFSAVGAGVEPLSTLKPTIRQLRKDVGEHRVSPYVKGMVALIPLVTQFVVLVWTYVSG